MFASTSSAVFAEPDVVCGQLNVPQIELRGERVVDHPLGPARTLVGRHRSPLRSSFDWQQANREQDADGAGEAELFPIRLSLIVCKNPEFP